MVSMEIKEKAKTTSKIVKSVELTNDRIVPVYEALSVCQKIKARKISFAVNKYLPLKELVEYLQHDHKVLRFKSLKEKTTSAEDELIRATNKLVVVESKDGTEREFLVPTDKSAAFRQISFKYVRLSERYFYKCISDKNSMILLKFKYTITDDHTIIHFIVFNIDSYTMKVRKHMENIILDSSDGLKFDIRIKCEYLCILWSYQKHASVLDFNASSLKFSHFEIEEDLTQDYDFDIFADYLTITILDVEFGDSVFSVTDVSKRLTSYYVIQTGQRFDSKKALSDIAEFLYLEHPTYVIYLNSIEVPMWLVLEYLLPQTTLVKLIFCGISDGYVSHVIKEIDFSQLFAEYKDFFKTTNENQYQYQYCHMTSQLFLWTSKRHVIIVNTKTFLIEGLLELKTEKYFDFNTERFEFIFQVSRDGKVINVFVKKGKDVLHLEQFVVPSLKTLKLKSLNTVTDVYPKPVVDNMKIQPSLKNEILISY